jgi:ring-1,2-phenylacetyl-CoA epoxidase subunit PaaD
MAMADLLDTEAQSRVAQVWQWLAEVPDPEIPVISLVELGIIRDVTLDGAIVVVAVTPTYSGCPATVAINFEIERKLRENGVEQLRLERRLSPPWTTDWISRDGREKLRAFGITPPIDGTAATGSIAARIASYGAGGGNLQIACPRCGSTKTQKISQFGSTPCKASYRCTSCLEPFDYFKCI